MRAVTDGIRELTRLRPEQLMTQAKELARPTRSSAGCRGTPACPCPTSPPGGGDAGRRRPDDAARSGERLRRQRHLQVDRTPRRARRRSSRRSPIIRTRDARESVGGPGGTMRGIDVSKLTEKELLQTRGW